MPKLLSALVLFATLITPAIRPPGNPASEAFRKVASGHSKAMLAAAKLMPAEKYGYQPTPAQMTFGQLIAHIVQTNAALCSGISGTASPMTPEELKKLTGTEPKDALAAAIKRSFDYCTEALSKVSDSQLAEEASMFGRRTGQSRGMMLVTIANDWADHYSTAAGYLRLNNILPPTAQPKK